VVINAVRSGPNWKDAAIITYDENGGFWDHVAPPVEDRWGPGTRIPAIVVSPFAKKGYTAGPSAWTRVGLAGRAAR
jgi:phospholipase C